MKILIYSHDDNDISKGIVLLYEGKEEAKQFLRRFLSETDYWWTDFTNTDDPEIPTKGFGGLWLWEGGLNMPNKKQYDEEGGCWEEESNIWEQELLDNWSYFARGKFRKLTDTEALSFAKYNRLDIGVGREISTSECEYDEAIRVTSNLVTKPADKPSDSGSASVDFFNQCLKNLKPPQPQL